MPVHITNKGGFVRATNGTHRLEGLITRDPHTPIIRFATNSYIPITTREAAHYSFGVLGRRKIPRNPQFQYVEVGAGLGGLIPLLCAIPPTKPPIVIDPVPYESLYEILDAVAGTEIPIIEAIRDDARRIRDRCALYMDEKRVRHIRLPLHRALREVPDIVGCADVVVDHYGPAWHGVSPDIKRQERLLLKQRDHKASQMRSAYTKRYFARPHLTPHDFT